jgi:hypothetical protein
MGQPYHEARPPGSTSAGGAAPFSPVTDERRRPGSRAPEAWIAGTPACILIDMARLPALFLCAPLCLLPSCGHQDEVINGVRLPDIEFARFLLSVLHTHMHLEPGNTWVYEAVTPAGTERTTVVVLDEERAFQGVPNATTVQSSVMIGDVLVRDGKDWYAQDNTGAVWHLGKDTCEYEAGECASTDGSWEWSGEDARPGIVLPAGPTVGAEPVYQVYYKGMIEDVGEVIAVGESLTVPAGTFNDCVTILETSKLDPAVQRKKHYCPIVGVALVEDGDVRIELMDFDGV